MSPATGGSIAASLNPTYNLPTHAVVSSTVVIRDSKPSYAGVALGVAAGAVMGATLSTISKYQCY